jgi:hypothetical protein
MTQDIGIKGVIYRCNPGLGFQIRQQSEALREIRYLEAEWSWESDDGLTWSP